MTQKFFYGRPLVLLAIGLIAGILAGRYILGLWAYCFSSAAALLSILLWKLRVPYAPLVFVAAAIGVLRITVAYPVLPAPAYNGVVSGRICETPVQTAYSWNLTLDHAAYDGNPLDGRVLLRVYADELECGYGQVVAAGATLSLPTGARNEGGMDARFYYLSKNIVCTASTNGETLVLHDGSLDFYGRLQQLRNASTRVLVELMGERNGTLAAGMLHGDVQDIPDDILDDFRASGITHLLSVSGLHVSLLTGVLLFLLKRVKPVQIGRAHV